MKSYRTLALKELLSQKVTSILILIAVVLSTMMTTIVGQSIGVLSAMREQQAIAIGGNRYATFLQMNADQLHALEQDERLSYVGKSIYMGSLELSPSLTLGLMEYLDDNAAIYPSSTSVEEGRLPEAPMEIALSEDILKYLGFEGGIGDKITLSLQKNLRHNIVDSYSYTAEFVLTGRLKNNYLGYTSGTVTGVVGEGTAEQLLPESYIYYNVDIQTTDKKSFQAVVDDINKELNIHELDTSYNIVYLNALGISYTANSEDANDKGFSFMTVAGILVGSLILLAAGLVIYNILKISVSKRIKGYGTLRAIGGEKGQLYQIIVIEVILLCLMGIPIGMLLGFLSARGILEAATGLVSPELFLVQDASELKTLIAENSSLNGTLLVLSGAITLAFALFAALPAARSAARVSPIMAMSGTNLKIRRRKRKTKKIHNFEAYYGDISLIKDFADRHSLAVIVVHHIRKQNDSDVFNKVSGTTGLTGSADATFVLEKEKRASDTAKLYVTGRDTPYQEYTLRFRDCSWELVERKTQEQLAKETIPDVLFRLVDFMRDKEEWAGTATELLAAMRETETIPTVITKWLNEYRTTFLNENHIVYQYSRKKHGRQISLAKRAGDSGDGGDSDIGIPPVTVIDA